MILNRDRFAILSDAWGRFRSLALISPIPPSVGAGDDGFLWVDIGVDGTPEKPIWKIWDEPAGTWRQIGGAAGTVDWDDVAGKPSAFPPEAHTHAKLVASDGSPDPAVYCDSAGRFKANYGLDVTGTLTSTGDVYITGDNFGVMNRLANCYISVTDHFRSGSLPPNFYWAGGSTPSRLIYSYAGDYLKVTANQNTTHTLGKALGAANPNWSGKRFVARIATIGEAGIELAGIRLNARIGGTWYYAQMLLNRSGTASSQYVVQVTTNLPGASGYTTSPFAHAGMFVVLELYVHTNYDIYTYIRNEIGWPHGFGSIGCNVSSADLGEIGLVFQNTSSSAYGASFVDWFYTNF